VREVAHAWKRNPLSDLNKILQGGRYPRQNHLCKFWWWWVKGFMGGVGSKFALLHWLWSSPLQHSCTIVRMCEYVMDQINHVSFRQGWSWYDHPLPSYSVIAADTLRDLVTLTFHVWTLISRHTWRVTWSIPPPSLKMLWLSVLELWLLTSPIGYHWQCVCSHCACAVWPVRMGQIFRTYLKSLTPICLFTIQLL